MRKFSTRQVSEGQDPKPHTTSPEATAHFFSILMRWRGGVLTRYFAYLYFAGIRPHELKRHSSRESELVNLKTRTVTIPANISKTRHERHVTISSGLVTQAFRFIGKDFITPEIIAQLRQQLSEKEKDTLRKDIALPPAWIAAYFRQIIA